MSYYGKIISWIAISVTLIGLVFSLSVKQRTFSTSIDTLYGRFDITDPLVIELLQSDSMQRIRGVHQYGVLRYATPIEQYSRYEHCIGVYALLRRYGLSHQEQIAGLIHDISRTTFSNLGETGSSNLGDFVFNTQVMYNNRREDIHTWYLRQSGLNEIFEKYGYSIETIHYRHPDFRALKRELPALCADRIDYNLQGGLRRGLLTRGEADTILSHLRFEFPNWYFTDIESAKKLSRISINMTENLWGSAWGLLINKWVAEALGIAMSTGIITLDEFHFSTDDILWEKLANSSNPLISEKLDKVLNYEKQFSMGTSENNDVIIKGKFRGLDPLVMTKGGLKPLTEIDETYNHEFFASKAKMEQGWPIKLASMSGNTSKKTSKDPGQHPPL